MSARLAAFAGLIWNSILDGLGQMGACWRMGAVENMDRPASVHPSAKPSGALEHQAEIVRSILQEMIDLAKPDDLAFLEMQLSYIARKIVADLAQEICKPASSEICE